MKKTRKILAMVCALTLTAALAVGGTLAFLSDKTDAVKNTFTIGNVDITLGETTGANYKMVPGATIDKNPKVTVVADSEACWLFVKVEEHNVADYITYAIADGWTELDGVAGVYYRKVAANATADQPFDVLAGNKVTVKDTVTNDLMDAAEKDAPTLTFTAYAVQQAGFDDTAKTDAENAALAWAQAQNASTYPTPAA